MKEEKIEMRYWLGLRRRQGWIDGRNGRGDRPRPRAHPRRRIRRWIRERSRVFGWKCWWKKMIGFGSWDCWRKHWC